MPPAEADSVARSGRPAKSAAIYPGKAAPRPDDRLRTARQPHRRMLKAQDRMSEQAESPLGRLYLKGLLRQPGDDDGGFGRDRYEAGTLYAYVVGQYRSTLCGPTATAGAGRGFDCKPEACAIDPERCECRRRRRRYDAAFVALGEAGRRAQQAVARVAVWREPIGTGEVAKLIAGLDALRRHFGLTPRRRARSIENAN